MAVGDVGVAAAGGGADLDRELAGRDLGRDLDLPVGHQLEALQERHALLPDGLGQLRREEALEPPHALELLDLLVRSRPRALSKQHIRGQLWPDTVVGEASLTVAVADPLNVLVLDDLKMKETQKSAPKALSQGNRGIFLIDEGRIIQRIFFKGNG